MLFQTEISSPVGRLTLAGGDGFLCGLWIRGQKYFGESVKEEMYTKDDLPVFRAAEDWLNRYFSGKRPAVGELPLRPSGTPFRLEVWKILCGIPFGEVTTYGAIAEKMARKAGRSSMSAQAVGNAVGHNPISIIIPCHRVVGAGGNLTGYAAGIEIKRRLLLHEGWEPPPV